MNRTPSLTTYNGPFPQKVRGGEGGGVEKFSPVFELVFEHIGNIGDDKFVANFKINIRGQAHRIKQEKLTLLR